MRKSFLSFFTLLCFLSLFSQDTIYLNNKKQVVLKKEAEFYKIIPRNVKYSPYCEKTYLLNGQLKFETIYKNYRKKKLLKHSAWYDSGKLFLKINYKNGKINGEFLTFWENGNLRRKDIYKKGKFIKGVCLDKKGGKTPYFVFLQEPKFPGGKLAFKKYIKNNIQYKNIFNNKDNINAIVKFFIDCKGKITDFKFIKKSNILNLDINIVRAIMNMPDWKPAKQENKSIGVWRTLPLKFK